MGIAAIVAFYAAFFAIGAYAGRRRKDGSGGDTQSLLLANRRLPTWLAVCTLISTWVGGGYIIGTAEAVFDPDLGLVWTQAPWCYALSLVVGGLFFVRRMRRFGFTTMLDLFERRYGKRLTAFLYIPALLGDLFWMAAILSALGAAFATVLDIDPATAIVVSAIVAMAYTVIGGLWSVAFTDTLQLACIVGGLCLVLPFALPLAGGLNVVLDSYQIDHAETMRIAPPLSAFTGKDAWGWIWGDFAMMMILGGIPWQVYFQRVLACKSDSAAIRLSVLAGVGCLLIAIPVVIIGMIGSNADWSALGVQTAPEPNMVLPYVMRYMTPPFVATLGLCAVAAAVMSSIDSSLLSASSMFAWNVYRPFRREATDEQIRFAMRAALVLTTCASAILAITVSSTYALWVLCADLVYVILFPQLLLALFDRKANIVGATAGLIVSMAVRSIGGEPSLGIPSPLSGIDSIPLRTIAMLSGLITIAAVSRLTGKSHPPHSLDA